MPRPTEYENLIKTKAFEAVQPTLGAVPGYLKNARDYLEAAKGLDPAKSLQVFTMAYEGYYAIVRRFWSSIKCAPKTPAVTSRFSASRRT